MSRRRRLVHHIELAAQGGAALRGQALRRENGGVFFDADAQIVEIVDIARRMRAHEEAAAAARHDQALTLEQAGGLAHGRAADAELAGDGALGEFGARCQAARHDRFGQYARDLADQVA